MYTDKMDEWTNPRERFDDAVTKTDNTVSVPP